jgi:hypothetical protein
MENKIENEINEINKQDNDYNINIQELNNIRKDCERMNKFHQIEILKILKESGDIILNENNYGTFINMSDISINILEKIKNYIEYVNIQESHLLKVEKEKTTIKSTFFGNKNTLYC